MGRRELVGGGTATIWCGMVAAHRVRGASTRRVDPDRVDLEDRGAAAAVATTPGDRTPIDPAAMQCDGPLVEGDRPRRLLQPALRAGERVGSGVLSEPGKNNGPHLAFPQVGAVVAPKGFEPSLPPRETGGLRALGGISAARETTVGTTTSLPGSGGSQSIPRSIPRTEAVPILAADRGRQFLQPDFPVGSPNLTARSTTRVPGSGRVPARADWAMTTQFRSATCARPCPVPSSDPRL
jgi:hypothetical protein